MEPTPDTGNGHRHSPTCTSRHAPVTLSLICIPYSGNEFGYLSTPSLTLSLSHFLPYEYSSLRHISPRAFNALSAAPTPVLFGVDCLEWMV